MKAHGVNGRADCIPSVLHTPGYFECAVSANSTAYFVACVYPVVRVVGIGVLTAVAEIVTSPELGTDVDADVTATAHVLEESCSWCVT